MDKTIFVNDEVFTRDADYIIGGFQTDKKENFSFTDFQVAFHKRTEQLINEYIDEACMVYGLDGEEDVLGAARMSTAKVICDNLKIIPENLDPFYLKKAVIESQYAQKWLFDIRFNINNIEMNVDQIGGILNYGYALNKQTIEYQTKEQLVTETDFGIFIEQLSMIET